KPTVKKAIHNSTTEITRKPEVMYSDALAPSELPNRPTIRKPSSGRKTMAWYMVVPVNPSSDSRLRPRLDRGRRRESDEGLTGTTMYQAIVFLPLLGFLIVGLFGNSLGAKASEYITSGFLVISVVLLWIAFFTVGF